MNNKSKVKTISVMFSIVLMVWVSLAQSDVQTGFPDTPAGKRAGEVLALLNGTFPRTAEDYIQNDYTPGFRDSFPLATHKQIYDTTKGMFGILELSEVVTASDYDIRFIVRSESKDAWLNVMLRLKQEAPFRIAMMGLRPGSPSSTQQQAAPETAAKQSKSNSQPASGSRKAKDVSAAELDSMIASKAASGDFSGVVLIARDGNPIFQKACGYASKRFHVPNRVDTKFNLGSINKAFTTVAILQLIEKGKLSIDDPIGMYLDVFPEKIAEKVTIRHLLNMRSGWGDYWSTPTFKQEISRIRTVSQYMDFIKDMPLDFEPGTNFQHSNTGFDVAGAIIERVTGMDYYDYVRSNIYEPAGMDSTDCFHKDGPVENLAVGYTNMNPNDPDGTGYAWENTYLMPPRGNPTGGGYSTAEDMLKFSQALKNQKLLSKEMVNFYFNRLDGEPEKAPAPNGSYRAAGAAPGINAFLVIDFDSGLTFVVLANLDHPVAMNFIQEILKMYGIDPI
jgi:CubicO group peptidase (beta-lactamase class C family)